MALREPAVTFTDRDIEYTGRELRSHWIYDTFDLRGDAAVAFLGAASVRGDDLVDLEDRRDGAFIYSPRMLHIIVESFGANLERSVMTQRILVMIVAERLFSRGISVVRRGDDLFVGEGKLSVSIATVSPVSNLVHLGINLETDGAPVAAAGLTALGIDGTEFGREVLALFAADFAAMDAAGTKVRSTV